jgi:predicted metal-dependent TIM-barrel fold hydrolase
MAEQHSEMPILREPDLRRMLAWEVQRATRYQDFLSLCVVRLAHPRTPLSALREGVARKLVELLRSSDVVGTVGEDLVVLLVHTPSSDALGITERLQRVIQEFVVAKRPADEPLDVVVQWSLVAFPSDATSDELLLARAQARLPGSP